MTENQKHAGIVGLVVILILAVAGGALFLSQKSAGETPQATATPVLSVNGTPVPAGSTPGAEGGDYSMSIDLSEGNSQPQTVEPVPLATAQPLSPEEIDLILGRLPTLPVIPGEQVDFKLPLQPIPPPLTGDTINEPIPPVEEAPTPPPAETGPLYVVRYAPEGEVPIAPFISVTFNQPMVPLGTLEDLAKEDVPVIIEPPLEGTWRWIGTKTLTFEYDSELIDRLPKATEFRVTVPAGTKSATGGELAEAVTWTFTTPAPRMVVSYPYNYQPQPRDPIFFISFDQRINPAAVLETIQVMAGSDIVNTVLLGKEDVADNAEVSALIANTQEGRWLVFKAVELLPADTGISVTIGPGTPSAEGSLVTSEAQTYSFSTYAPLRIEDHGCSWYDDQCRPLTPFFIRFNNSIDMNTYREDMLKIEPEIPGLTVNVYGNYIEIHGETQGRTTYRITVSGDIQDIFGQTLGEDATLKFDVGDAKPMLIGPGQIFVTSDPVAEKPVFSVYAINYDKLHVMIYSVQPTDWPAFKQYMRDWQQTDQPSKMPGELLSDKTISLDIPKDTLTEIPIDLSKYLEDGSGHFIVMVEPPKGMFESEEDKWKRFSQTIHAWVQVTQIGVDAFNDHSEMLAWTTALRDGAPLSGATIKPDGKGSGFKTAEDGTVRMDIPSGATYLVATKGNDSAILPRSTYYWGDDSWYTSPPADELRWYVFDDRKMYRPGEEVHIKGWLRQIGGRQDGDVGLVGKALTSVHYQVIEPQGNLVTEGDAPVNEFGGFDFAISLPQAVNLGTAQVNLSAYGDVGSLVGTSYYHSIEIQEFRRPEFEVNARNETTGPYFAGGNAILAVEAKYYAGGALPNADTTWQVTSTPTNYAPPNWPEFTFGTWQPWWWYYEEGGYPDGNGGTTVSYSGKTDATGTHYLRLDFNQTGSANPRPFSVVAQGTVMDVNRQAWSSSTSLMVHPADVYIGLRSERYFVEKGTPYEIDFIVTDLDGNVVPEIPVEMRFSRLEWKYTNGIWHEEEVDTQTCSMTSTGEPGTCTFETSIGGSYRITATVTDTLGRKNQTQMQRWVTGGQIKPSRNVEQEQVTLIPDKETYQPGDVAEILVQSPFSPAEGLLTVTRSGILYTERFQITDGTATLKIPIEEKYIPNLNIQVDLNGSAPRTDDQGEPMPDLPPRPAYATGQLTLNIPPLSRTLALDVTPEDSALEPGGQTTLDVRLTDAAGKPVSGAELAVVVVDEAILALTNYQLTDPISVFYSNRPSYLSSSYGRASLVLVDPLSLEMAARDGASKAEMQSGNWALPSATMMPVMEAAPAEAPGMGGANAEPAPISVRSDFNPLALFAPSVRTGADGSARVTINLPDNLTRYRIMVVAVDSSGSKFGTGESNLTARLPLMVRPSAPRFLNFGDVFELPVVLQNQTDEAMEVNVIARATNLDLGADAVGYKVSVPANDRVEVRFPASTDRAGTARVQLAATSGENADAATVALPVYTPATTEAFATYGVIADGTVVQPVLSPTGVYPQFGGLEVNTSSTALSALTDAVLYLQSYPFECSEQLASRILSVAALRDVLTAFDAAGLPSPAEMEAAVTRDLARLQGMQNDDGGFPYWRRGFESIPFNTIHVAHAAQRAREKGFEVPAGMQERALDYLRNIESHYPEWYDQQTRWTLSAYALYVRDLSGERDAPKAEALLNEAGLEALPLEAIGWLWPVIDDPQMLEDIRVFVNNHVVETPGAANFTTYYSDQTYLLLSSDRRTDAILLDSLIGEDPQSDLIPKVVNGLLAHRVEGRWNNTQENVFVLVALDRYFNTFETQTPDFVARLWLGDTYLSESQFQGYSTDTHQTLVPMDFVIDQTQGGDGTEDLILSKEGDGRLYYRIGLRYAPTDLKLDPLEMGFVVTRRYEAVDDPEDVYQDSDGVWHIKAGASVRVRISMVADNRRYHVALVDPLPAGLEIVNPALAVSGSTPQDPSVPPYRYGWWWSWTWYEHQNLRDERAEAFTSLLWEGVYDYTYIARATTPGTFVVPPAKAEEMYSPEVFGRSASDVVIVK